MTDDNRCCGTGNCIIDADGLCWCGQVWDGEKMCFQPDAPVEAMAPASAPENPSPA